MNYLAHIFLSFANEDLLVGNFMADFIRNKEVEKLSPQVKSGIDLHRMIDSFTDNHELVREGTKRLRLQHGKYAPVVIDILYDFILANNWELYNTQTLESFSIQSYEILLKRIDDLPDELARQLPLMIEDDFLLKYRSDAGLKRALLSMDRRAKFPSNFIVASLQLRTEYDLFNNEFNRFFPELINKCKSFISTIVT